MRWRMRERGKREIMGNEGRMNKIEMTELEKKDWVADLMYEIVWDLNRWDKNEIVTVCKKIITICNL